MRCYIVEIYNRIRTTCICDVIKTSGHKVCKYKTETVIVLSITISWQESRRSTIIPAVYKSVSRNIKYFTDVVIAVNKN